MAIVWAPETADDFERIYRHNAEYKSDLKADLIEEEILRAGNSLKPFSGSPWGRFGERRFLTETYYWIFFRVRDHSVEIFAVFHAKETWSTIVPHR